VHNESLFIYLSIKVLMAVRFIWASHQCHMLGSEIVRHFRVDLVLAAIGALDDSVVGCIVGELSVFLLFLFLVVDDRSAFTGTIIYVPLISLPARLQEDDEVMEHFPFQNIVVCLPKTYWFIDRRVCQKVGLWRASTGLPCMTLTNP